MKILLADIMYKKNMTVRQVAIRSGISKSTISRIMNQETSPTMEQMEYLAAGLKVRINDLYESEYK